MDMNLKQSDFTSEEEYVECLKDSYIERINEVSAELISLIESISASMSVVSTNGIVSAECRLNNVELQVCAMKIPALCAFLQTNLAPIQMTCSLDEFYTDMQVSQLIKQLPKGRGEGTASERMREAELTVADKRLEIVAMKQYVSTIQDIIHRADKLYEGIKKTLDYRGREIWFDNKTIGTT